VRGSPRQPPRNERSSSSATWRERLGQPVRASTRALATSRSQRLTSMFADLASTDRPEALVSRSTPSQLFCRTPIPSYKRSAVTLSRKCKIDSVIELVKAATHSSIPVWLWHDVGAELERVSGEEFRPAVEERNNLTLAERDEIQKDINAWWVAERGGCRAGQRLDAPNDRTAYQSGLLRFSVKDENMTLKLTLMRSLPLSFASTECST